MVDLDMHDRDERQNGAQQEFSPLGKLIVWMMVILANILLWGWIFMDHVGRQ